MTATEGISRYYTLLREPARRRIIEILGTQGKVGFKELREDLDLGVGTIYYHLDMLSDFLSQDKHRKYLLNDRGRLLRFQVECSPGRNAQDSRKAVQGYTQAAIFLLRVLSERLYASDVTHHVTWLEDGGKGGFVDQKNNQSRVNQPHSVVEKEVPGGRSKDMA